MIRLPPPIRFIGVILGGWIAMRAVALVPAWTGAEAEPAAYGGEAPAIIAARTPDMLPAGEAEGLWRRETSYARAAVPAAQPFARRARLASAPEDGILAALALSQMAAAAVQPSPAFVTPPPALPQLFQSAPRPQSERRFAGSAWLFLRDGDGDPGLAPGGELGGSQAGFRATYRIAGRRAPLALSARAYLPADRPEGAEAALGLDWRPLPGIPINLLAERRQALGREGRSDFALMLYGGGERRVGPVRVEAWAQAGAVGVEDPDLFADGLVRATVRAGPFDLGGGAWGGAQPGATRLDAGPHVSARLPMDRVDLRLIAEWRFRVAGDAAPGSGPAVTIASSF